MTLLPTPLEEAATKLDPDAFAVDEFGCYALVSGSSRRASARTHATAAITAYLAHAGKEGWVVVPVEPTRGMVCAYIQSVKSSPKGNPNRGRDGKDEWMAAHTEKCSKRWRAMLAAAQNGGDLPAPPMGK